jgi:polyisoprenoid-binding protein YceI
MEVVMHAGKLSVAAGVVAIIATSGVRPGAASDVSPVPAVESRVTFVATGPAGMKIEGTTPDLKVSSTDANVVVTVPLSNLSTGISLRDRHMKDIYLEVGKFPETTLTIARAQLKVPPKGAAVQADVPATLTLHGQSKPVSVHYDARSDAALVVTGRLHVVMTDFGITVPSYLGVTVKPDVDVNATFKLPGGAP